MPARPRSDADADTDETAKEKAPRRRAPDANAAGALGALSSFEDEDVIDNADGDEDGFGGAQAFNPVFLPAPPKIPGYHVCWLSTTNQHQPVDMFLQRPYSFDLVRKSDVPNFDPSRSRTRMADTDDFIRCNEMILARCPEAHYQRIMLHNHHTTPNDAEAALRANVEGARDDRGRRVFDGLPAKLTSQNVRTFRKPIFE